MVQCDWVKLFFEPVLDGLVRWERYSVTCCGRQIIQKNPSAGLCGALAGLDQVQQPA